MSKLIIAGVIGTFTLGVATMAFAGGSERRIASTTTAASNPIEKNLSKVNRRLSQSTSAKVNCRSVRCVNNTLTNLAKRVKTLERDAFKCEKWTNITSYSGYIYTPDNGATTFPTSAIDYTESGDARSDKMVVYTC